MDTKTKLQGIYMVPLILVVGMILFVAEMLLILTLCGPAMLLCIPALFACLFVEGHGEPWKAKTRWIRATSMPYIKCHAFLCKLHRSKQRI